MGSANYVYRIAALFVLLKKPSCVPRLGGTRPLVPGSARLKNPRWRPISERNGFSAMEPTVTACKQATLLLILAKLEAYCNRLIRLDVVQQGVAM